MMTLPPSVKIFVALTPTDMRKSFDGLSLAAQSVLRQPDPTSGHLFVFWNRRCDQVRILFWDRTGYCIYARSMAERASACRMLICNSFSKRYVRGNRPMSRRQMGKPSRPRARQPPPQRPRRMGRLALTTA